MKTVMEMDDENHILNEKYVLNTIKSPFCLELITTFKDTTYVYFLTEVILGGDLFTLLAKKKRLRLDNGDIQFYAGCIILAFEALHEMNIIYRDLKPENILINHKNGYLKLIDFGLTKKVDEIDQRLSNTLCGTIEYLCPEVIQGWSQSFAVDYWTFGILIYEMIYGKTPFEGDDVYHNILTQDPVFDDIPENARDLIKGLLNKNVHERLGAGIHAIDDIKKHSFFEDLNFEQLLYQQLKAPFVPKLKSPVDTSNFDDFDDDMSSSEDDELDDNELYSWAEDF